MVDFLEEFSVTGEMLLLGCLLARFMYNLEFKIQIGVDGSEIFMIPALAALRRLLCLVLLMGIDRRRGGDRLRELAMKLFPTVFI